MLVSDLVSNMLQEKNYRPTKEESLLLEANLFSRITDEFLDLFKEREMNYLKLLKCEKDKDEEMLESDFLKLLVNDIVATNEYTMEGIANVLRIPTDVILDIATGMNTNPSLNLGTKIMKLHSSVRKNLYDNLIRKVMESSSEYASSAKR